MVKSSVLLVTVALSFLTACESRQTQTTVPAPTGTGNNQNQNGPNGNGSTATGNGTTGQNGQTGQNGNADAGAQVASSIPITLDAKQLKQRYALDTTNLTYHFKYQATDTTGAITFTADKATLTFSGLKANEKSDLVLELLQGNVVKLRGEVKDLILSAGAQRIDLKLSPVDGNGGDLTIDVTTDQPASGSTGTGAGTGTGSGTATGSGSGGGTGSGSGTDTSSGSGTATGTGSGSGSGTGSGTGSDVPTNTNTNTNTNTGANTGGGATGPSFAKDVKPILDEYCVECHHDGAQFPDLSVAPDAGLIGLIVADIKSGKMPKAPRDPMPAAKLGKLIEWKKAGSPP